MEPASFAYIEAGYGQNDEHPASFQPVLVGQLQMSKIINAFMASSSWNDSVFFFSYDEGGGPYDHVPPCRATPTTRPTRRSDHSGHRPDFGPAGQLVSLPAAGWRDGNGTLRSQSRQSGAQPDRPPTSMDSERSLVPLAEHRDFAVHAAALRFAYSDGPHGIMKFVENRFIGPSAHLTRAMRATEPFGFLRLRQHPVGHTALAAGCGDQRAFAAQYVHTASMGRKPCHLEMGGRPGVKAMVVRT